MQTCVLISILKTTNLFSTVVIWHPTGWHMRISADFGRLLLVWWLDSPKLLVNFHCLKLSMTWLPQYSSSQLGSHVEDNKDLKSTKKIVVYLLNIIHLGWTSMQQNREELEECVDINWRHWLYSSNISCWLPGVCCSLVSIQHIKHVWQCSVRQKPT